MDALKPDHVAEMAVPDGAGPVALHLVMSEDGLYVPALVRTPARDAHPAPWPAVVCLHGGSGGEGIPYLLDQLLEQGAVYDRLLAEGYAVCVTEGRAEAEGAYGTSTPATLDHQDVGSVFRHLQAVPEIDPGRIAFFGVSHGGELQLKLISELGGGPAALIPAEPAVIEYLGLHYPGERVEAQLQFNGDLDDEQIDLVRAMERIQRIPASLPILVIGRDGDHLQGLFRKLHELLVRAGRDASWTSFDHPEHAYQLGPRRQDGTYPSDPVLAQTVERVVAFLDDNVKG
jgi:acetyl esterase/lipase